MREVEYDYGYMFAYSSETINACSQKMEDDIPQMLNKDVWQKWLVPGRIIKKENGILRW